MSRFPAACLTAALGFSLACNTGPNPSEDVLKALKTANLNDVQIEWDSRARIAHLKGTVDTPPDRQRANEIASATVGTTGTVLNEVMIKGLNEKTAGNLTVTSRAH